MNTEKLEKLKKSLDNKFIPDNMKDKIRVEIQKLELEIKTDDTITATEVKEEVKEIEKKVEKALEVAEKKEEQAEAKAPAKTRAKRTTTSRTKTPKVEEKPTTKKKTVFSLAKEIRKAGESWEDAKLRARKMMKSETTEIKKKTRTETSKLLASIRRKKELKNLSGTNIKRDINRTALPKGKRISKDGNVYYENRDNRTDRLAPSYKDKIYLADGGGVDESLDEIIERLSKEKGYPNVKLSRSEYEEVLRKAHQIKYGTKYADGGSITLTPETPLARGLGISYTGLVGETGAMSSGEMFAGGGQITISEIKRRTSETSPYFFDAKTMKFFNQKMSDFKVRKLENGKYEIYAPRKDYNGKSMGVTKRIFNPETNELEFTKDFATGGGVDKWIGYDKDHLMNMKNGMIVLRGTDLKDIKPKDIKGFDMLDNRGYADGGGVGKIGYFIYEEKSKQPLLKKFNNLESAEKSFKIDNTKKIVLTEILNPLPKHINEIEKGIKLNLKLYGFKKGNYEQGGSLVDGYLTDPNFGDFQAGVYEMGGNTGLPAGTEQHFVNYYLGEGTAQGIYAKGGGVRMVGGREYPTGRNWTNEHKHIDKADSREVNYTRKKSFNDGGAMQNFEYDDVLEVLKEKLEGAIEDLPMDYENSDSFTGEEVEKNSRDGFIAYTNGGYEVNWFEYMSMYIASGKSLPTKPLDTEMDRQVAYNYEYAKERFVEEYPEIVEELGEDNIDYNSLYDADYGDEAEQLSEWEMDFDGDDTILCEIGAYYYDTDNSRGIDEKHTIRLFGYVNLESPYHRRGNLDDSYDIDITFDSISELKEKVDAGLKEIIDWFDGKYYNDSTTEMKIRRMEEGGFMDGVYAKGGGVSPFKNMMETNTITEKEINLIKLRMNNDKVDNFTQEAIDFIWDNSPQLTSDQNKKGIDYLRNLWKSPTGKERVNSPFGYREENVLETFEYFELRGFYDAGNQFRKFYVPLYTCVGTDSSFEYAFYGGKANILG